MKLIRPRRRHVLIGGGVLLAAGALLIILMFANSEDPPEWADRYPELLDVDAGLVEWIRAELPEDALPHDDITDRDFPGSDEPGVHSILKTLSERGRRAPHALLAVLLERHGEAKEYTTTPRSYTRDRDHRPIAGWLSQREDREVDAVLLRMCVDEAIEFDLRLTAVVALCRPGQYGAVAELAAIANDGTEDPDLRREILYRLPRIGLRLDEHVGDLQYLPFHGLDRTAAAAVIRSGDIIAPTLVLDALREGGTRFDSKWPHLVEAVREIAEDDAILEERARVSSGFFGIGVDRTFRSTDACQKEIDRLAKALSESLARRPDLLETEFERGRREYLSSERFRRERAIETIEDMIDADETDLDLAACALLIEQDDDRERKLESIDRIVRLLRKKTAGLEEPEELIAALNRSLLSGPLTTRLPYLWAPSWRVGDVLESRHGDCSECSILYLAVADRLGLPFHASWSEPVLSVRFDDGHARHDLEVVHLDLGAPDLVVTERASPVRIGKKRILSELLVRQTTRLTYEMSEPEKTRRRVEIQDQAIRLDSRNALAHLTRAWNRLHLDPPEIDPARDDLRRGRALYRGPHPWIFDAIERIATNKAAAANPPE